MTKAALNVTESAEYIGVSPKHLFNQTWPRGPIRALKIGNCLRYRKETLDAYLRDQEEAWAAEAERLATDKQQATV